MRSLLLNLCIATLIISCSKDDPLYSRFSPESVKGGFVAEVTALATYTDSIPVMSTTVPPVTVTAVTTSQAATVAPVFWDNVERWRSMVTESVYVWGGNDADVHRFLRIMQCESAGLPDAKNPNSSASGLMQHLTRFWPDRSARAGLPNANVFDPYANIFVSAWLALEAPEGGWHHWVCK